MPLLRAGAVMSPRLKAGLERAGLHTIYVDDELSAGIDPTPLLSDKTRAAATAAVAELFGTARAALDANRPLLATTLEPVQAMAALIAEETEQAGGFALALTDLSPVETYDLHHSVGATALGLLIAQKLYATRGYLDFRGQRTHDGLDARVTRLGLGLLLRDIGKLALPTEILDKPGELDTGQWEAMKTHPLAGVKLLKSDLVSPLVKVIVRSHHERWDGAGYPDGKAADEIHELARIAAVADVYDAITSERVYAKARPAHVGVRVIREGRGTAFDPEIVDVFSKVVAPFPPGDSIELADGRAGVVASVPEGNIDRPVVRILHDGSPYELPLAEHPDVQIAGWEDMDVTLRAA
jgi:HD-GYP domain-containing protein (c-di-GMP phosphodiesterase class II)